MNFDAPVRVACLGAGYFSRFHYDAWKRIERVELVGAADHDISRAQETGIDAFATLGGMLEAAVPDLLDIIVPPGGHLEAIETAIEAGVRAIVCQKPFCASREEAGRAVERAARAGVTLIVHENFRFQPWYRAISGAVNNDAVGEVQQVTFRLRPGDGQGPDAYLDRQPYFQTMERFLVHETAVHWIDTFRFLLGEPETVYADLRQLNPAIAGEDAGHILFGYGNGVRALFDGNRLLDHPAANHRLTMGECMVEGATGTLSLLGDGSVWLRGFGDMEATPVLVPRDWPGFGGDCVFALQNHVIAGLLDGAPIENLAGDYLRVLDIEAEVYRSAEEHRRLEI